MTGKKTMIKTIMIREINQLCMGLSLPPSTSETAFEVEEENKDKEIEKKIN